MIAPITLVAAKVMPRRIIETRIVPKIPARSVGIIRHAQRFSSSRINTEVNKVKPR